MLACSGYSVVEEEEKTDKNSPEDYPWRLLSGPALSYIPHGFWRRATQTFKDKHDHTYRVQATQWKDKKLVAWLHTLCVNSSTGTVFRRGKRQRYAKQFKSPNVGECPEVWEKYPFVLQNPAKIRHFEQG